MRLFRIITILFAGFLVLIIIAAGLGKLPPWLGFIYSIPYGDALVHLLLLGTLSFLANLGFPPSRLRRPPLLITCLVIAALITLEELSQLFLANRSFSLVDLSANYLGIFAFGETAAIVRMRFA